MRVSMIMVYYSGNLRFYVSALEEECRKIQVFRRELPLCYQFLTQTIEVWKQKMVEKDGVMECDLVLSGDQTSPDRPVLEEFIPLRDDTVGDHNREERKGVRRQRKIESDCEEKKKLEWLSSTQLWNPIPDLNAHEDDDDEEDYSRPVISENPLKAIDRLALERQEQQGRGDHKTSGKLTLSPADSSTSRGGLGKGEEKHQAGNSQRKQRRCWSTELHRQFLNALEELGGQHVATPKQIKERMKVDGLTNDEIKSHLQKYRLHTKQSRSAGSILLLPTQKIYAPVARIQKASLALSSSPHTISNPFFFG